MSDRLRLVVGADRQDLPAVKAALRAFTDARGVGTSDSERVVEVALELCEWTLANSFSDGRRGTLSFDFDVVPDGISMQISDNGQPMLGFGSDAGGVPQDLSAIADSNQDLRLVTLGAAGKRLSLTIPVIGLKRSSSKVAAVHPDASDGIAAMAEDIIIRDALASDAEGISRLLYRTYGWDYGHDHAYDPSWIAERIQSGELVSAVALLEGEVIGHHALLVEPGTPCAESGLAVTDSALQGVGVGGMLGLHAQKQAVKHGIPAVVSRGVTTHPYSQRAVNTAGFRPTALLLACVPHPDGVNRAPLLTAFLCPTGKSRGVSVPTKYGDMLKSTYENLGLHLSDPDIAHSRAELGDSARVSLAAETITHIPGTATITVTAWGSAELQLLSDVLRRVVRGDNQVAYADLDLHTLTHAELDELVEFLRNYDFFFSGLMIYGPHGHDYLRLQALLTNKAQIEGIVLDSAFAQRLGEFVISDIGLKPDS